ncbi:MAG: tetratricopeptide repeat protein [Daejeonella sp.]
MFKKTALYFILTSCFLEAFAQKEKPVKTQPIVVVGKVLTFADSNRVKRLYLDGLHQKITQNPQSASDYFTQVIEIDPANDAALYELALIEHDQQNNTEAEKLIRNAVTITPDNRWYWSLLSEIYKDTNNLTQLILVFDELIKLSPDNEEYYFDKARALLMQNKVSEATTIYDDIEKKYGRSENLSDARQQIFMMQGKPDKAASEIEKQIKTNPDDLRNYVYLSEIYAKAGDHSKAIAILQKAKTIDSGNAMIRLSLADNYRSLNNFTDAFIELKVAFADINLNIDEKVRIVLSFFPLFEDPTARAYADELAFIITQIHPADPKSFSVYGDVLFQEEKYPAAKEAYRKALKLNDQVYQIWEQLLRIDISQNNFIEAITDGEEALTIFPNQAQLYFFTGFAYAQTQKTEKAVSYFKTVISLETEDKETLSQTYSSLGDAYHTLKKYKESDESYEKALQIKPDNSYTLNNYAYYLALRNERLEKAEKMSKRSNQLEPANSSFQDTYAWILFRLKKYAEARLWMERAIKDQEKDNSVQIEHYGDIIYHLGEKEQALEQWKKAKTAGGKSGILEQKINEKRYVE